MARLSGSVSALMFAVLAVVASSAPASAALGKRAASTPQSDVNKIVNSLTSGLHASYDAVYNADYTGVSQTVTMAQKPPKFLFKMTGPTLTVGTSKAAGSELNVNTGSKTYGCNIDTSPATCFVLSSGASYAAEEDSFRPSAVIFALETFAASLSSSSAPDLTTSSERIGGQSTSCISIQSAQSVKYCVTKKGVLASVVSAGNTLQLERVSPSVSNSLFKLPAGAHVEGVHGVG